MFKGIKWTVVVIVMIVSLAVLVGGWSYYQENNIKEPIIKEINNIKGVSVEEIFINTNNMEIDLKFENVENLQAIFNTVLDVVQPNVGNRKLTINISNNSNKEIKEAWDNYYFYIAEAIKQHSYSLIPKTIAEIEENYLFDNVSCTMDKENIYITIQQYDSSMYIVIPTSDSMEVNSVG